MKDSSSNRSNLMRSVCAGLLVVILPGFALAAVDADDPAIKKILKNGDCFKCHAPDKTKKAASYNKISEKLKGKPPAEAQKIVHDNLTKKPKVKLDDGTEEEHKVMDSKDPEADIKSITQWLLK